jgi:hypothetical protein
LQPGAVSAILAKPQVKGFETRRPGTTLARHDGIELRKIAYENLLFKFAAMGGKITSSGGIAQNPDDSGHR